MGAGDEVVEAEVVAVDGTMVVQIAEGETLLTHVVQRTVRTLVTEVVGEVSEEGEEVMEIGVEVGADTEIGEVEVEDTGAEGEGDMEGAVVTRISNQLILHRANLISRSSNTEVTVDLQPQEVLRLLDLRQVTVADSMDAEAADRQHQLTAPMDKHKGGTEATQVTKEGVDITQAEVMGVTGDKRTITLDLDITVRLEPHQGVEGEAVGDILHFPLNSRTVLLRTFVLGAASGTAAFLNYHNYDPLKHKLSKPGPDINRINTVHTFFLFEFPTVSTPK